MDRTNLWHEAYGLSNDQAGDLDARANQWKVEIARGNRRMAYRLSDEALSALDRNQFETTLLATPLSALGLPQRIFNMLSDEPFRAMTLGGLLSIERSALELESMIGASTVNEIYIAYARYVTARCLKAEENVALAGNGQKVK